MQILLAELSLSPGGVISWLVVGLVAGWLAGSFMKGGGFGIIGDIIVGLIGAFLGGLLVGVIAPGSDWGFIGSIFVSFIGACVFIAIARALGGTRRTTV